MNVLKILCFSVSLFSAMSYASCRWPIETYTYTCKVAGLTVGYNKSGWRKIGQRRYEAFSLTEISVLGRVYRMKYRSKYIISGRRFQQLNSETTSNKPSLPSGKYTNKPGEYMLASIVPFIRYRLMKGLPIKSTHSFNLGFNQPAAVAKIKVHPLKIYHSPYYGKMLVTEVDYSFNKGVRGKVFFAVKHHYLPVYAKHKDPMLLGLSYAAILKKVNYSNGCIL